MIIQKMKINKAVINETTIFSDDEEEIDLEIIEDEDEDEGIINQNIDNQTNTTNNAIDSQSSFIPPDCDPNNRMYEYFNIVILKGIIAENYSKNRTLTNLDSSSPPRKKT